jgi:hypothetical protein
MHGTHKTNYRRYMGSNPSRAADEPGWDVRHQRDEPGRAIPRKALFRPTGINQQEYKYKYTITPLLTPPPPQTGGRQVIDLMMAVRVGLGSWLLPTEPSRTPSTTDWSITKYRKA